VGSTTVESRPRLGRDSRREAILDVAAEVFVEVGYSNASMSTIAARLGGSKGTLYNYFKSKEELFTAYVLRHCQALQEAMFELLAEGADVQAGLTSLGRTYLTEVMSDRTMRNFRVITAEADRTPEIGRTFYEAGPLSGAKRLAIFLKAAAEEGRLRLDDPLAAAHQFLGLCQHRMLKARLCAVLAEPTPAEIDAEVAAAVKTFVAAFGPA